MSQVTKNIILAVGCVGVVLAVSGALWMLELAAA